MHDVAQQVHENAVAKGFWPEEGRNFGEQIALIHSEASEALEEHRDGKPDLYFGPDGKPEGVLSELADVAIRTFDSMYERANAAGYTIDEVIAIKMRYNAGRAVKHGKAY